MMTYSEQNLPSILSFIVQQGTFDEQKVTLDPTFPTQYYSTIDAKCEGDCAVCFDKGAGVEKFTYYPADVMLIGKSIIYFGKSENCFICYHVPKSEMFEISN
jgi:hypothetical protein